MPRITNEFKVGLFVIVAVALVLFGWQWSYDGVRADEGSYTLYLRVPDADGLWKGTPVKMAGVEIGAVESIAVDGSQARLTMLIREAYQLPLDTVAELRASGLLGDRFIAVFPGASEGLLKDQDVLELRSEPGSIDEITRNVEVITDDLREVTKALRELAENDRNSEAIEGTLANVEALSLELRLLAERNSADVSAIVDSVRRLSEHLEALSADAHGDVDEEMEKIKAVTDKLDAAVADLESITSKIDDGDGTLGALVNDDTTIELLNDTLEEAGDVIDGFSGMHAEVYYVGRLYAGTQPNDPSTFFFGNPLAGGGSNTLGLLLQSQEDFWYVFEINDYPLGTVWSEERYLPELGSYYTEYVREPNYRFTFMLEKRWGPASFRLGVKENGGGVGATLYAAHDRVQLSADAFDFEFGSYPAIERAGTPNTRLALRIEPIPKLFFEAGAEQLLLGAYYGYATGFVGVGFHFQDDDIKLLLATLPLPF